MLPGNNKLGTLKWKGRYYVCSTVDRAEQFGCEPDLFILAVRQLVARHTVLDQMIMFRPGLGHTADGGLDLVDSKTDASSQTEIHPMAELINPDYKYESRYQYFIFR